MLKTYCLKAKAVTKSLRKSRMKIAIPMYWLKQDAYGHYLAEWCSGRIALTSNFVGVCFSPARLKQRTETRTQTIRLPLCIDQTACSRFRGYVSLIQGFLVLSLNVIQATKSYTPSQYSDSGKKMKHSLADLTFSGSFLSVFPCRTLHGCFGNRITRTHLR